MAPPARVGGIRGKREKEKEYRRLQKRGGWFTTETIAFLIKCFFFLQKHRPEADDASVPRLETHEKQHTHEAGDDVRKRGPCWNMAREGGFSKQDSLPEDSLRRKRQAHSLSLGGSVRLAFPRQKTRRQVPVRSRLPGVFRSYTSPSIGYKAFPRRIEG